MQNEFWHERWEKQQIGFHLDEVNKVLLKYWPAMQAGSGSRVLVPLCGKTLDIVWLLQQGHAVVGIELSEIALDELAAIITAELQLDIEKSRDGDQVFYRADKLLLIAGDFFAVKPQQLGKVDVVYDRAALVALPKPMRDDYCRHLWQLSQQAPQLLVTFTYDQQQMPGPPFAVLPQEVEQQYQPYYHAGLQEQREIIDTEPRFRERGVTSFLQDVFILTPR